MRKVKIGKVTGKTSKLSVLCPLTKTYCVSDCAWYSKGWVGTDRNTFVYAARCHGYTIGQLIREPLSKQ